MSIKTYRKAKPYVVNITDWIVEKDSKGKEIEKEVVVATIKLPGEIPLATALQLYELQSSKGNDAEATREDIFALYETLLGEDAANELINNALVSPEMLEEILNDYNTEITARKDQRRKN